MLHSLNSLSDAAPFDGQTAAVTCRFTDELHSWLEAVQNGAASSFAEMQSVLDRARGARDGAGTAAPVAEALRCVTAQLTGAVVGSYTGFPGPMCSPFRRAHAQMLRQEPYTFTEKSDGIRVLALLRKVPHFPRWVVMDAEAGAAAVVRRLDHLANVAALERGYASLQEEGHGNEVEVALRTSDGRAEVAFLCRSVPGTADTFRLEPRVTAEGGRSMVAASADAASPAGVNVRRCCSDARYFLIAVDRTMTAAHLFLHSPLAPCLSEYEAMVVDGELMLAHPSVPSRDEQPRVAVQDSPCTSLGGERCRLVIGLFDVFSFKKKAEREQRLTHEPMSRRYQVLKEAIAAPQEATGVAAAGSVSLFAKSMWPVSELPRCVEGVVLEPSSRRYWFNGPFGFTQNDGFIFTPETFPICGGASRRQVKWKWRSLLSVDWLVTASDTNADEFNVWLFFRKMNHGFRADTIGHWKRHKPMRLLNPHAFDIPVDCPVVVECVYNSAARCWSIARLRRDRSEANSIVTVISVLESVAENISLAVLHDILGLSTCVTENGQTDAALWDALDPVCAAEASLEVRGSSDALHSPHGEDKDELRMKAEKRLTTKLGLRAVSTPRGGSKLTLYWVTNTGNPEVKRGIPCQLCLVRECSGLGLPCAAAHSKSSDDEEEGGEDAPSELEDFLYIELANAGGSCGWSDFVVDAYFDGAAGHWVLGKLHPAGNNSEANFDWLLNHLQWVIDEGGGAAATKAIPAAFFGPPAHIPRAAVAETKLTNAHYARKAKAMGSTAAADSTGGGKPASPTVHQGRGALRRFNNWVKAVLLSQEGQRMKEKVRVQENTRTGEVTPPPFAQHNPTMQQQQQQHQRFQRGDAAAGTGRGHPSPYRQRGGRGCRSSQSSKSSGPPQSHAKDLLPSGRVLRVADICCGRGGDLLKWRALEPGFLYMTDASFECVAEAAARYCTIKGLSTKAKEPGVPAHFAVHDAFDPGSDLQSGLFRVTANGTAPFHLVSCQFSMHYGCFSEQRLTYFLATVSSCLSHRGGLFVGTTVDDAELLRRFRRHGAEFGNAHYHIRFPPESVERIQQHDEDADGEGGDGAAPPLLPFGIKYFASVEDSVTELPEYLVPWRRLENIAARHKLRVILDEPFRVFAERNMNTPIGQEILCSFQAGGKRSREPEVAASASPGAASRKEDGARSPLGMLSEEEQEAVSIYRAFVLEKHS